MSAYVFIKNNIIHYEFEDNSFSALEDVSYDAGFFLPDFLRFDLDKVSDLFDTVITTALNMKIEDDRSIFNETVNKIAGINPYLYFYANMLIGLLYSLSLGKFDDMGYIFENIPNITELDDKYEKKLADDEKNIDDILLSYYPGDYLDARTFENKKLLLKSVNTILYIKEGILNDIAIKRDVIRELLSGDYSNFTKRDFSVSIAIKDNEPVEIYTINNILDIVLFEHVKILSLNIRIKICAYCGNYFASYGRSDTIYCSYIVPETNKTCSDSGAQKKFKEKTNNPVYEHFNRAYKRNNAKLRSGKIDKEEFTNWAEEARQKRDACLNEELELSDFIDWLGNKK